MEKIDQPDINLAKYTSDAPIILASDYPPSAGGGGAVMLRSLIGPDARPKILWASASPAGPVGPTEALLTQGSAILKSLIDRRSMTVDVLLAHRLASELSRLAAEHHARAFWLVMHGAMVHVAARLLKTTRLPVHLTVHDDPIGVTLMSRRYLALLPLVQRDFAFAMRRAASVDVVSDGMASRYRRAFDINSIVVHRGMPGPIAQSVAGHDPRALEIGILGNTYGFHQLPIVARAVEIAAARSNLRGRIVVVGQGLGERLRDKVGTRIDVEVTGHLDEPAAIERLARCFCLYLNYPFSPQTAIFRQTSFPTKLTTYLMAGRPLLAHAGADSSLSSLAVSTGYIARWSSEIVDEGATEILRLWNLPSAHESQHAVAEEIRQRYFDLAVNRRRLFRALDALVD